MNGNDGGEFQHIQAPMRDFLQRHWKLFTAEGVLFILLGLSAVVLPHLFSVAFVVLLGGILLFAGAVHIGRALVLSAMPGFASWLVIGILEAVVGYLFIARPASGVSALTVFITLFFALEGFAKISLALVMRPLPSWVLVLLNGLAAWVFALLVALGWAQTSQWVLGLLLGINMIFLGFSLLRISLLHKTLD